jgi:hypothetical protein
MATLLDLKRKDVNYMGRFEDHLLNQDSNFAYTSAVFSKAQNQWASIVAALGDAGAVLTSTPLGANASYIQEAVDRIAPMGASLPALPVGKVRGFAWADKAGTLYLEESDDNTTWTATATVSVTAKTTTPLPWTALTKRWYRFNYTNGGSAQGSFVLVQQAAGLEVKDIQLTGSKVEKASAQDTQIATTEKTYTRADGASQIEVYVESGYVRVRTDGQPCTDKTGEPIAAGFGSGWQAESISVFFVQESIITVVSR